MEQTRLLKALFLLYALAILIALGSLLPRPTFLRRAKGKDALQSGRIAVVHVYGPIRTSFTSSALSRSDADEIVRHLHRISEDREIKAIILRINSPGGTVGGVQEIYSELQKCRAKGQKIVASLGDVAASGGYYLAAAADRIVANPGTLTGSIGVIMEFGNLEGLFQKLGVRLEVIKSGEHKDIGSPARPMTPEEQRLLQASITDTYRQFVDAVAQGRHLNTEQVRKLADGRLFTGRQALEAGLVDELGNSEDAVQVAIRLAHLPSNAPVVMDSSHSVLTFLKRLGAEAPLGFWDALARETPRFSLEYSLR